MVCRGSHTISWWCKLQSNIAISSCEAELNASLKGAVEGLNVQRLAATLGDELPLVLKTDTSAARGVLMRQGVGKVRHLQVKQLWLQENVAAGELIIAKIPRVENYADALTHPWSAHDLPFWEAMGICFIPRKQVSMDLPSPVCPFAGYRGQGIQVTQNGPVWPLRPRDQSISPFCVARVPAARSTSGRTRLSARRYLSLSGPTGCPNLVLVLGLGSGRPTEMVWRPGSRTNLLPIPNAELVIIIFLRACGN